MLCKGTVVPLFVDLFIHSFFCCGRSAPVYTVSLGGQEKEGHGTMPPEPPPSRVLPSALPCSFSMISQPISRWAWPSLMDELDSVQPLETRDPAAVDAGQGLGPGPAFAWLRVLGKF